MTIRTGLSLLMALATVGQGMAAPLPGLGYAVRRQIPDMSVPPWNIVGRFQTALGGRCTGFAIAPRVIMTAAHCVWIRKTKRWTQPSDVHVLMRYRDGGFAVHAQGVSIVTSPHYDPDDESRTIRFDYAAIVLDRPVVNDDAILPIVTPSAGQAAMLGGYQQDRQERLVADTRCRVMSVGGQGDGQGVVRHNCAGTHGASGAPLFIRVGEGRSKQNWAIGGLDVAAFFGRGGIAIPLP